MCFTIIFFMRSTLIILPSRVQIVLLKVVLAGREGGGVNLEGGLGSNGGLFKMKATGRDTPSDICRIGISNKG